MAPMTRCRAENNLPNAWMAEYYAQRSGAGLIISEGTSPSPGGLGYARMPGLFNDEQEEKWAEVCKAVHLNQGLIFLQIMHTGRIASSRNLPPDAKILAPSSVTAPGTIYADTFGLIPHDVPEAMSLNDINSVIRDYAHCAKRAIRAGFDGVEIHSASGYLPNQFLSDNVNLRTDQYGGSAENKIRFVIELLQAVLAETGEFKTGIKISPGMTYNDIIIRDNIDIYHKLISRLNEFPLAYLHVMRVKETDGAGVFSSCRKLYKGNLMVGGGFDDAEAAYFLNHSMAELIAVGTSFIANPDLDQRWAKQYPLAQVNRKTFYTPGPQGYTDYPKYHQS